MEIFFPPGHDPAKAKDRVHPQADNIKDRSGPRPGWLRIEDCCLGMITGWIGMKLGRKLKWDPIKEKFEGDETANQLLSRTERAPYGINHLKKA